MYTNIPSYTGCLPVCVCVYVLCVLEVKRGWGGQEKLLRYALSIMCVYIFNNSVRTHVHTYTNV